MFVKLPAAGESNTTRNGHTIHWVTARLPKPDYANFIVLTDPLFGERKLLEISTFKLSRLRGSLQASLNGIGKNRPSTRGIVVVLSGTSD